MQEKTTFTIIIDAQEITVHYYPYYFVTAGYAQFEFTSPFDPPRQIPISETGYRSHFSPMHEIEAAPSVQEYASLLAQAIINKQPRSAGDKQMQLF